MGRAVHVRRVERGENDPVPIPTPHIVPPALVRGRITKGYQVRAYTADGLEEIAFLPLIDVDGIPAVVCGNCGDLQPAQYPGQAERGLERCYGGRRG